MSRDVPNAWKRIQFDKIAKEISLRNRDRRNIPVLSITKYDGFVLSEEYFKKKVFSANTENYKIVGKGQFAYATIHLDEGSIDHLADFKVGLISPMYTVFELDEREAETDFILRLFKLFSSNGIFDTLGNGGVNRRKSISFSTLGKLEICIPPLHEQRRISEILSSVDDAIAATQAVIEQTKKVKQATLERLLTKGIGHTRFKQTEMGEIPDRWIISTADEICSQISVGIVIKPSRYYTDNGIRCFRSANVREGFIEDADWVFITEEGNRVNRKSILKTGDVLVVRTGYPGTSCVVTPEYDGANCIDIIFARPDLNRVEPRFLSAFINSESGKLQVLKAEGGLAQKHFNVGSMKVMKIPLPTIAEQREIVRHIEDFTQAENSLKKLLEQYNCMKSALMSDLLTGRKRVTDTLPLAAE